MLSALREMDKVLLIVIAIILGVALLSLYSVSHRPGGEIVKNYCLQQAIWIVLCLLVAVFCMWVGYERMLDYSYIIFTFNILLLVVLFVVGSTRLGARRWISLGLFNLQPSELCKVSFILILVKYVGDNLNRIYKLKVVIASLAICVVPMILIIKQPDLGTAIAFLPVLFFVLFIAGVRKRHLFYLIASGLALFPVFWHMLKEYQKKRLFVFLNPDADPLGAGYTIIQSKIAVGSGGFFGKGWMSGTQNQLNFLPERHTDFIFSVIGEEWGFVGAVLIIGLFVILMHRLLGICSRTSDERGRLLIVAIVTLLWFQVFVNIAMAIGLMPVVGLTLPLISYGGSSLMTTMILIALAMSVRSRRKIF